jgi:hypothetical protein
MPKNMPWLAKSLPTFLRHLQQMSQQHTKALSTSAAARASEWLPLQILLACVRGLQQASSTFCCTWLISRFLSFWCSFSKESHLLESFAMPIIKWSDMHFPLKQICRVSPAAPYPPGRHIMRPHPFLEDDARLPLGSWPNFEQASRSSL